MKKRPREPKPILPALKSATRSGLIKSLASCNTTVRSQSLRLLQSWLESESHKVSGADINRLWKGLFYCLWHADKSPNQVALIERYAAIFVSLRPELSSEFFRYFLITLRREWSGIDRLRLDKYYLLIRKFVRALFDLMRLKNWDCEVLRVYFGALERNGLLPEDNLQGNGVSYHLVSVFMEELKGVEFPVKKEVVELLLKPFFAVLMKSRDKVLLGKVEKCVFGEILNAGRGLFEKKKMGGNCVGEEEDSLFGVVALRMGFSDRFYEIGSSVECFLGNRNVAFKLQKEFLKLEKELELSGIEITVPDFVFRGVKDDEIPELIPIDNTSIQDEDQADVRSLKKSKKGGKRVDENGEKSKKKKKKKKRMRKDDKEVSEISSVGKKNGDKVTTNNVDNIEIDEGTITLTESVISNLQKQFEKVAAESELNNDEGTDLSDTPPVSTKVRLHSKKRKRSKSSEAQELSNPSSIKSESAAAGSAARSVDKSAKRVRFSMKNNLEWKPQTPLPPESLRLPPSVTPRGSALKKGVPPGPVIEMIPAKKKAKKKKAQKVLRNGAPAMIRRKKIRTVSA